jgi:hypothetical protein
LFDRKQAFQLLQFFYAVRLKVVRVMPGLGLLWNQSSQNVEKEFQGLHKTQTGSVCSVFWVTVKDSQNNQFVSFNAWKRVGGLQRLLLHVQKTVQLAEVAFF